jgi:hypothetical protein
LLPSVVDASADVSKEASIPDAMADRDGAQEAAVKPKRTVISRNPFGNYARASNLLLDGDFEWLGGYSSQYPWISVTAISLSFEPPTAVVGIQCRSGLKCASVDFGTGVGGIGLRTQDPNLKVSAWMRPPASDCAATTVSVGACFHSSGVEVVPALSPNTDAEGWCHFESTVAAPDGTPCLFVSNDLNEGAVLLDDMALEGVAAGGSNTKALVLAPARHLALVDSLRAAASEFMKPKPPGWNRPAPFDSWPILP